MSLDNLAAPLAVGADSAPGLCEDERTARLRLSRSHNVGPRTFAHLVRRFGSAAEAIEALPELAGRGGSAAYEPCPAEAAMRERETAEAAGARLAVLGDPHYPALLNAIDTPPPALWIQIGRAHV